MTSNLTVCYMAAKSNEPHVERAAIRAALIQQAIAIGRVTKQQSSAVQLTRPGLMNRFTSSIVGLLGALMAQTERA